MWSCMVTNEQLSRDTTAEREGDLRERGRDGGGERERE